MSHQSLSSDNFMGIVLIKKRKLKWNVSSKKMTLIWIIPGQGYCFNGDCPTLTMQCEAIWGYGGAAADQQCYDQFNTKGSINGHCGVDVSGHYKKCDLE